MSAENCSGLSFLVPFISFKLQNLFLCLVVFWVFFGLVLFGCFLGFFCVVLLCLEFIQWKEEPWQKGKNRLHVQLARGTAIIHLNYRAKPAKISQAGRFEGKVHKDKGPEAE